MCYSYFQIFKTVKLSNTKINAVHHHQRTISTKVDLTAQTSNTADSITDNQEESEEISKNKLEIPVGFPKPTKRQTSKQKEELRLTLTFLVVLGLFISCLVPNCIYIFLSLFPTLQIPRAFGIIAILSAYMFGSVNPIIYLKMNRKCSSKNYH